MDEVKVIEHEDGSATVEMDGDIVHYTKEEVDEMLEKSEAHQ